MQFMLTLREVESTSFFYKCLFLLFLGFSNKNLVSNAQISSNIQSANSPAMTLELVGSKPQVHDVAVPSNQ